MLDFSAMPGQMPSLCRIIFIKCHLIHRNCYKPKPFCIFSKKNNLNSFQFSWFGFIIIKFSSKDQIKPKVVWARSRFSPQKTNSFVHFFGRIYGMTICFRFYLTFSKSFSSNCLPLSTYFWKTNKETISMAHMVKEYFLFCKKNLCFSRSKAGWGITNFYCGFGDDWRRFISTRSQHG